MSQSASFSLTLGFPSIAARSLLTCPCCCARQGRALERCGESAHLQHQQHSTARPGRRRRPPAHARQQRWVRMLFSFLIAPRGGSPCWRSCICPRPVNGLPLMVCTSYAGLRAVNILSPSSCCRALELHVSSWLTLMQILSWGHSGRNAVAAGEVSGAAQRAAVMAQPSSRPASALFPPAMLHEISSGTGSA